MNNFVDSQGNPIADDQLDAALQSGELSALPGTRVNFVDASGIPFSVPAEEAGQALAAGMRPEASAAVQARRTREQHGTAGQQVLAGVEGAARGLTFGLSDVALSALGDSYSQGALARQQANPFTAGATEVLGAVAPAIATMGGSTGLSGGSLAARAATAVPRASTALGKLAARGITGETTLARMAARAAETGVAGAFEGMVYGAGSAIGQSALKNQEITAEKILSGGAHGALIGGLLGGGLGAVSGISKGAARGGDDMLLRRKLDKLDATIEKQAKAEGRAAEKASGELSRLQERSGFLDRLAADQALKTLKPSSRTLSRHAKQAADVDGFLQEAGQDFLNYQIRTGPLAGKRIFHAAKDPADAVADITHAFNETDDIVRAHKATAAETIAANPELAPDLNALTQRIGGDLEEKIGRSESKMIARLFEPLQEARVGQFQGMRGAEIDALEATRQNIIDAIDAAKTPSQARALKTARLAVDDALRETTEGALTKAGVDTTLFRQEARMHRSLGLVKDAADELKAAQFANRPGVENHAAGYALAAALSGNFGGALGIGASMLGQKYLRDRASGIIAELARKVSRSDVRTKWGAKALSGDGFRYPMRTAVTKALTGGAAERFYSRLAETAANPEDYTVAQTEQVARQYPELAVAMQRTIAGDLQYLAAQIPGRYSRAGASLTPGPLKPVGTKASGDKFWEAVHALEDPGYVVDELLSGRVPLAAIEALKERRPNQWSELRMAVAEECAARADELSFKRRIVLGTAFEFPADRSLMPGALTEIQMTFAPKDETGRPVTTGAADMGSQMAADMAFSGET